MRRRHFLGTLTAGAATLTLPTILRARARKADPMARIGMTTAVFRFHFPQEGSKRRRTPHPDGGHHVVNRGGLLWVLGFKTENSPTRFTTTDGGLTEIIGGCAWTGSDDENGYPNEPAIVNRDSHVSASFMESCVRGGGCEPIAVVVQESRDGVTRALPADGYPRKALRDGLVLPLYTGYDRSQVDEYLRKLGFAEQNE